MEMLKLDNRTIQVLRNFSTINPSILIRPGNKISTISPIKTIMATTTVPYDFNSQFAIYDLSRFLSTVSLMEEPSLDISDKVITIKSGKRTVNYTLADPSAVVSPPETMKELENLVVSFEITNDILSSIIKGMNVLRLPEIAIIGDGSTIQFQTVDSKNPSGDVYSIEVGQTDKEFSAIIRSENVKLLPGDYKIDITPRVIKFYNNDLAYYIAVESHSKF
jgi:hypothetical protein